jgi:hypothetical protein
MTTPDKAAMRRTPELENQDVALLIRRICVELGYHGGLVESIAAGVIYRGVFGCYPYKDPAFNTEWKKGIHPKL